MQSKRRAGKAKATSPPSNKRRRRAEPDSDFELDDDVVDAALEIVQALRKKYAQASKRTLASKLLPALQRELGIAQPRTAKTVLEAVLAKEAELEARVEAEAEVVAELDGEDTEAEDDEDETAGLFRRRRLETGVIRLLPTLKPAQLREISGLGTQEVEALTYNAMRYALLNGCGKRVAIEDSKLRAIVSPAYTSITRAVIALAQDRLRKLFGLDLVQGLASKKDTLGASEMGPIARKDKMWFLVSQLDLSSVTAAGVELVPTLSPSRMGLLIAVAAFIVQDGGSITLTKLSEHLREVDGNMPQLTTKTAARHPELGNVLALLSKDFVSSKYLMMYKENRQDCPESIFKLGPRLRAEVSARAILGFILTTMGVSKVTEEQVQQLLGDESKIPKPDPKYVAPQPKAGAGGDDDDDDD